MDEQLIELDEPTPGTRRRLRVVRFGRPGARPKAYLQAGLHGDELPGILVLLELEERLARLDAQGEVPGEVVLVPLANPIGLSQAMSTSHLGRRDLADMRNFNRGWPDIAAEVVDAVQGRLGPGPAANQDVIRAAIRDAARRLPAVGENAGLRRHLFTLACDADLVLDLHCDLEAVMHLYLAPQLWPAARDLAALVGSVATLLASESGGNPFDEAFSGPWWKLAARFPDRPIPMGCLSATIEYRGLADVDPALAGADAEALLRLLMLRGLVRGDPGPLPPLRAEATPLAGVAVVTAPKGGLIHHRVEAGAMVEPGQPIAAVIDPLAPSGQRTTLVRSPIAGMVYARAQCRLARAGGWIAKIAGAEPLVDRIGRALPED